MAKLILAFDGHDGHVSSLAWSPNGTQIVSTGTDGKVRTWDANTGTAIHTFEGHTGDVPSAAWAPGSTQVVSAGSDGTVRLWDTITGKPVRSQAIGQRHQVGVDWSPDGTRVAVVAGEDLRIWDSTLANLIDRFQLMESRLTSVRWSPDSRQLATSDYTMEAQIWSAELGAIDNPFNHTEGSATSVDWSPDGKRIVTCGDDMAAGGLWGADYVYGRREYSAQHDFAAAYVVRWCASNNQILTCDGMGGVRVWDPTTGSERLAIESYIALAVDWKPDGQQFVAGGYDGAIKVWRLDSDDLSLAIEPDD